jgi:O-succinylbenzoic acid--CoA ligase
VSKSFQIPTFDRPSEEDLFLGSSFGLHSYGDLERFKKFFLQFLFDFDHDFDKPVGFLALSSDTLIFAIAACWDLGIPFVSLSTNATPKELKAQIDKIDPGLIFFDKKNKPKLDYPERINIKQLDLTRSLDIKIELGYAAKNYEPSTNPENVFGYFLTSGTTSVPKVVPLKRRQVYFAAKASAENFQPRPNHFWLLCLPLNHIGGISIILRSILYGSAIFRMKSFHPDVIKTFLTENKRFQAASLVPTMLERLMNTPGFHIHKNFKAILLGGGPIEPELVQRCNDKGVPLVPSYGMTETCAQISANPILKPSGIYGPMTSVGTLFEPNEIQIRDKNGNPIGPNNSGEIWLKGPQVFDGYLNRDRSLDFDEDGWFRTGDFGHINRNEQLFIESRRSDLIITGGENVSPYEVESELKKLSAITEAAVLGLPDKEWGQKVVAVVVSKTEQAINMDEIQKELKKRITSYKVPKEIIQANSLPRTQTGKVIRGELAKLFENEIKSKNGNRGIGK